MLRKLRDLLPVHARESGIVFTGDVFSKLLTFLITITLLRLVTPAEYALYGVFITVLATVNQFTDSGLHASFIRFWAVYARDDRSRAAAHLRFAWRVKLVAVAVTSLALLAAAPVLARTVFLEPALEYPLRLLGIGVIGSGMFEFLQAVYQARQDFFPLTVLRVAEAMGKLGVIYVFIVLRDFSLQVVYLSYVLVPLAVALAALAFRTNGAVEPFDWRSIGREVLAFGKWMMLSSFATMFLMRLDIFMLTPMMQGRPDQIGLYAAAVRLCTPLIVLTGSVSTVFTPKAMGLRGSAEMAAYVRRSLQVTLVLVALSAVYAVALFVTVPTVFPKYTGSLPLFGILFAGYAWTIVGNPITVLMLSINRPHVMTAIAFAQLAATLVSHYLFIRLLGATGAAVSTVLMWFIAGGVSMAYIWRHRAAIDGEDA